LQKRKGFGRIIGRSMSNLSIFRIQNNKLKEIRTKTFSTELELQKLVDNNLEEIFGFEFVKREFGGQGLSIDTIAYDPETKSPVLIEYKKDSYQSVVDQGMAYLHWLLTHKGDYQVALNEKLGVREIDWSQPKVIFIAKNFNPHQIWASGFKNAPFELYRYELCGDIFILEKVETPKSDVSITSVLKTKETKKIIQQVKTFTLDDHLKKANDKTKQLFETLRKMIFSMDERINEVPVSWYVGYKIRYFNFCAVIFKKEKLTVHVRKEKIDDPKNVFSRIPKEWAWGKTTIWRADIKNEDDINYVFQIIKQGYQSAPDL